MKKFSNILILIIISLFLSACLSKINKHGYSFELSDYQDIKENITLKSELEKIMGSPTVISFIGDKAIWIYFSQDVRKLLFFKPKIIQRKIMTIEFDNHQEMVTKIKFYNLEDEKKINYVADHTKIHSHKKSLIADIFKNIGKVSPN